MLLAHQNPMIDRWRVGATVAIIKDVLLFYSLDCGVQNVRRGNIQDFESSRALEGSAFCKGMTRCSAELCVRVEKISP